MGQTSAHSTLTCARYLNENGLQWMPPEHVNQSTDELIEEFKSNLFNLRNKYFKSTLVCAYFLRQMMNDQLLKWTHSKSSITLSFS